MLSLLNMIRCTVLDFIWLSRMHLPLYEHIKGHTPFRHFLLCCLSLPRCGTRVSCIYCWSVLHLLVHILSIIQLQVIGEKLCIEALQWFCSRVLWLFVSYVSYV